jgi:hypothetical protein
MAQCFAETGLEKFISPPMGAHLPSRRPCYAVFQAVLALINTLSCLNFVAFDQTMLRRWILWDLTLRSYLWYKTYQW